MKTANSYQIREYDVGHSISPSKRKNAFFSNKENLQNSSVSIKKPFSQYNRFSVLSNDNRNELSYKTALKSSIEVNQIMYY